MDPVTGAALITAGTSMAQGLMQAEAQRKQAQQEMLMNSYLKEMEMKNQASQNMASGQQNAFAQLMSQYQSILA